MLTFLLIIEDEATRSKLEELYIRYHKEMYYIAMSILNNYHDAQDAVQSAILKCTDYIDKIGDVDCNKTKYFIITIIKSTSIDLYRKKKLHPILGIEEYDNVPDDQEIQIEQLIIRLADSKWIAENLAKINPDYANILTLRYYYDLKDVEIAKILNISRNLVNTRLHRAKQSIKKMMIDESAQLGEKGMLYGIN